MTAKKAIARVRLRPRAADLQCLRLQDVCDILKISKPTLRRWVRDGKFPKGFMASDQTRLWRLAVVDKWLLNREQR